VTVRAEALKAGRLAVLQVGLRSARSEPECLSALAEMIQIAVWFRELGDHGPVRARTVLNRALAYLNAALAADGDHIPGALFLAAEASILRDAAAGPISDLDNAIACLRRLCVVLADDDPDLVMVELKLGSSLAVRAGRTGAWLADLGESSMLLTSALNRMDADDPGRREVACILASQYALRYGGLGGTEADRETAITHAAGCLAETSDPDRISDAAHVVAAWMALSRQLTAQQRLAMYSEREFEAARSDGEVAASLLAKFGLTEISGADAETAIGHLRQVRTMPDDEAMHGLVPVLWSIAIATRMRVDGTVEDVDQVADYLDRAISLTPEGDPERGELLAMRAIVLSMRSYARSRASASGGGWHSTTDAISDAMANLPAGHPMRSAALDLLGYGLGRQADESGAADEAATGLETVVDALERMPRDDPGFARTMVSVAVQVLSVGARHRSALEQERIVGQLEDAVARLAPDDPLRPLSENLRWGAVLRNAIVRHRPDAVNEAIEELIRIADSAPAGYPHQPWLLTSVAAAFVERRAMTGEVRDLERADDYIGKALSISGQEGPFAEGTPGYGVMLYLRSQIQMVWYYYDARPDRMKLVASDLQRAAELIGADSPFYPVILSTLKSVGAVREAAAVLDQDDIQLRDSTREAFAQVLDAAEKMPRDSIEFPAVAAQAASGLVLRGLADNDDSMLDRAITLIAEACSVPGLAVRERPRLLTLHGQSLCTRYTRNWNPRDLSNGIDRLEEARRAVEQEVGSPYAADVLQTLASAYRLRGDAGRGDVDRAVTMGLAGLRENAGDVMLQDSDENALRVARRGTSDAIEMARWFLDRGRGAAAVEALELGRGMVLNAATSGSGLEEALREAGQPGLAREWALDLARHGAATPETDTLRYRVMLALERSPAEARLLAPSLADITSALAETGSDALVYLLPRDDNGSGLGVAVVVDAAGAVRYVRLPGLYAGARSPVKEFLRARRDETKVGWLEALDSLCDWAWRAAVGPLLHAIPADGGRKERHIVLVPGGELGLVPWHAARLPGRRDRYACQEALISYAASARQFVDAAARRPTPWGQAPVLVSDAEGSPYLTTVGIAHLCVEYYPVASVFGSARYRLTPTLAESAPGSAAVSPQDILAVLPHADSQGASLLHFGCHGRSSVPVLGSSIKLGGGAEIAVRDILRQARTWQAAHRDRGGLVVLASCLSDVTDADYDEALTLATAFLTVGASGVVAARWAVAERETALFMAMFHHYLNTDHLSPVHALRAAQLWMLDPARALPDQMPAALRDEAAMVDRPGGPDLANPASWAGFAYQGR
jgi:hypothetical protein